MLFYSDISPGPMRMELEGVDNVKSDRVLTSLRNSSCASVRLAIRSTWS